MQPLNDNANLAPAADSAALPSSELAGVILHWSRIVRYRHKTLVVTLILAGMLGAVYYLLAPRYYQSTAKLLIIQRSNDQLAMVGEQQSLDNTMATHQDLVTSPVVIQGALDQILPEHRVDLHNTSPQFWNEVIARNLSAKTTRRTNFIEVNYRSLSPEAAAGVVSAVVQSYLGFVDGTHQGTASDVLESLTAENAQIRKQVALKQQELQEFRQRVGSIAVRSDDGIVHPTIQKALSLSQTLTTAQQERMDFERQLESIRTAISTGSDLQPYLAGLEETIGKQMMASALGLTTEDLQLMKEQNQKLFDAQQELKALTPFYGPAHPKVAELNNQISSIETYLAEYRANSGERAAAFGGQQLGAVVQAFLEQSVSQATRKEQQIAQLYHQAREQAGKESGDVVKLESLEREVKRLETQQDVLLDRIARIDIRQLQSPIQATVVKEPLPNDIPVSPQVRHVALMSLMAGFCLGGLIIYLQDLLDDRFSSPEEMVSQLSVPLLAMVRELDPIEGVGLATVHTHCRPVAIETEAFRTLRTAITLNAEATDRILISSAEPGDGKTTVSANLAVAFAQAGKRTLVIDADLRKPGMTARFGLKRSAGVADVLCSQEPVAEHASRLLHHTELDNLDVLPAGMRQPNPAELLSGPRFQDLLAWADTCYDRVLVDCPPVLAVSDAQVVGRLVDGAILVVRPEKNHRRLVLRACESFLATGSNVFGVVANGLTNRAGGYDYGYTAYGYGHEPNEQDEERNVLPIERSIAVQENEPQRQSRRAV
jgi:succinoglycan biosynthesis transport protein ExoP